MVVFVLETAYVPDTFAFSWNISFKKTQQTLHPKMLQAVNCKVV